MHGERGRVERAATSVFWSALCAARASLVRSCGALSVSNWVRRDVRVRVGCCAVGMLAYSFFIVCDCSEFEELLGFVLCKEPACALPWCRRLSLCMSTGRHSSSPVVTKLIDSCVGRLVNRRNFNEVTDERNHFLTVLPVREAVQPVHVARATE